MIAVALLSLFACSEKSGTTGEFDNWQARNDTWFKSKSDSVNNLIKQGSKEWRIYNTWKLPANYTSTDITKTILVQVLESGTGEAQPLYTDSILMHYQYRLIPSKNFPSGYICSQTFYGTYSAETSRPQAFAVKSLEMEGLATAVQQMHIGDRWLVYIPYSLAYGASGKSSLNIPGYSTMVCDISLAAIARTGHSLPSWKAPAK